MTRLGNYPVFASDVPSEQRLEVSAGFPSKRRAQRQQQATSVNDEDQQKTVDSNNDGRDVGIVRDVVDKSVGHLMRAGLGRRSTQGSPPCGCGTTTDSLRRAGWVQIVGVRAASAAGER